MLIALLLANPIRAAPALGFFPGGVCICHMCGEIPGRVRAEGNTTVSGSTSLQLLGNEPYNPIVSRG